MNNKNKIKPGTKTEKKEGLTRRDAIRKFGYAAFASSTMMILLNNPTKVHAQSPGDPGDEWEWGKNRNDNNRENDRRDDWEYDWD